MIQKSRSEIMRYSMEICHLEIWEHNATQEGRSHVVLSHFVSCRVVPCRPVSRRVVPCRVVSRGVVFRVSLFRVVSCHVVFHFVFSVPCHHSPCFLCRVVFPATLVSSFPVFLHHDILDVTHYYEILLPETKRTSPHVSCISSL